jgi:tyrosyl-DNA phosphodiesterase-1
MTQAAWSSPLLPLRPSIVTPNSSDTSGDTHHPIGSGERFKIDILRYFKAYGKRVAKMTEQLVGYDFSSIRAAFIGSAPSRQKPPEAKPSERTSFGWLGLQEVLSTVPITAPSKQTESPPHIILQVSSIATLGAAPTWLTNFQSALARSTISSTKQLRASPFFGKFEPSKQALIPEFNIIFPTPDEICTSLDGYASGASIHTKPSNKSSWNTYIPCSVTGNHPPIQKRCVALPPHTSKHTFVSPTHLTRPSTGPFSHQRI